MDIERKIFQPEIKEVNKDDLTIVHFISTEKKDRGGDIMRASGMKIKGKPVVLLAHGFTQMGSEPIAKPVWIKQGEFKNNKGIMAKTKFFPDDTGRRLFEKASTGFMPNWSIGFIPEPEKTSEFSDGGRDIQEWELLEYSLVGVPMNSDAQSLGIGQIDFKFMDTKDLKIELDTYDAVYELSEKDIEVFMEESRIDIKPYPNEHACRLNDPGKYIRIRRENDKFGSGIHAIWGIQEEDKPVELQAIHFSSDKFTVDEAKKWLKTHKYNCLIFEPATGKEENITDIKGVISYKKTPLDDEDASWDAGKEVKGATIEDLKAMCVWFDSENADNNTAYKGPHHRQAGSHNCVWNGVRALSAVIMGARGGMNMPDTDMPGCKRHVAGHYKDFDKGTPPWEKENGKIFLKIISDKTLEDIHMYALAKYLIPELAEFFEVDTKETNFDKKLNQIEAKMDDLIKLIEKATLPASSELAGQDEGKEVIINQPEPKRLVIIDDKSKEENTKLLKSIIKGCISEKVQSEIDKMRGKVK